MVSFNHLAQGEFGLTFRFQRMVRSHHCLTTVGEIFHIRMEEVANSVPYIKCHESASFQQLMADYLARNWVLLMKRCNGHMTIHVAPASGNLFAIAKVFW